MSITDYLNVNQVLLGVASSSKKQAIEELAKRAETLTGLGHRCLLDIVMRRERLGSTGIGDGIAIPHAVHSDLKHTIALLAVLTSPIDFESLDGKPVDIICLVIGPQNDDSKHLKCVSSVARSLKQATTCDKLRTLKSPKAILQSLQTIRPAAA